MSSEIKAPKTEQIKPQARQIIIETDGNNINITKNETAGIFELVAILQAVLGKLTQK